MKNVKTCLTCNEQFGSDDPRKLYCSQECYYKNSYSFKEGDTVGHLKLQSKEVEVTNRSRRTIWTCECCCGQIIKRRSDHLQKENDKGKMMSCGCTYLTSSGKDNPLWTGVGNLSGQYFSYIQCRAKKKDIEFNLTKEFLWDLFLKQEEKCALSGVEISLSVSRKYDCEQTASIDRIDSSKGYVPGNVQWVHKVINFMKRNHSDTDFILWCKLVAANSL